MIVEQRTYDIVTGRIPDYLRMYEAEGLAVQISHLGRLLGYFSSQFGTLNQIVHLWAYDDHADRERRRAALFADERWLTYFEKIVPLVLRQQSTILSPARFAQPVGALVSTSH